VNAVDHQPLNDVAERDHEVSGALCGDDRGDDAVIVRLLVLDLLFFAQKFFDDIGVIVRQFLPHPRTGIFGGDTAVDAHKAVDRRLIPVVEVLFRRLDLRELLLGVVDERGERLFLFHRERAFEFLFDLFADRPRPVFQDMEKRLVFSVNIRDEVLRALRKIERGREIDDLRRCVGSGGKLNGEPFEISFILHIHSPLFYYTATSRRLQDANFIFLLPRHRLSDSRRPCGSIPFCAYPPPKNP